jgi:Eco57I restriction-modification methylase
LTDSVKHSILLSDTDEIPFITTELLKCHIKSKTGQEEMNYEFNNYVGDTLDEKCTNAFKIKKFDAVIGNPPYNKSKDGVLKGGYGGRSLWDKFVVKALEGQMVENGYLLYVHPPSW